MTVKSYNFEVQELSISFAELLKWLQEWRGFNYGNPDKVYDYLNWVRRIAEESRGSEELEDVEAHRVSVYMTANFATGNDYKYPDTQAEADVQNLLCFVQSGAFFLIVERLEGVAGRSLKDDEKFLLLQLLHDLTYEKHAERYPELEEEKEEEQ